MSHKYITLRINNNTTQDTRMEFQKNDGTVIDDISKFNLSIIRFSLPLQRLPLLLWDESIYKDNLYIGVDTGTTIHKYSITKDDIQTASELTDCNIYSSQRIINLLNYIISIKLNALLPAPPVNNIELLIHNNELYIYTTEISFNNGTNKFFVSPLLFNAFLSGFDYEFKDGRYYINFFQDIPANTFPNVAVISYGSYINFNSLQNFNIYTRTIVITSTSLKTESEYIVTDLPQERHNIVTDYEIDNRIENKDHSMLYYNSSIYRLISLMNNGNITDINLQVYYVHFGKYYPLFMPPMQTAQFKLLFIPKNITV
jgi:hypothetical protein